MHDEEFNIINNDYAKLLDDAYASYWHDWNSMAKDAFEIAKRRAVPISFMKQCMEKWCKELEAYGEVILLDDDERTSNDHISSEKRYELAPSKKKSKLIKNKDNAALLGIYYQQQLKKTLKSEKLRTSLLSSSNEAVSHDEHLHGNITAGDNGTVNGGDNGTVNGDNGSDNGSDNGTTQVIEVEVLTTTRGRVVRRDPKVSACFGAYNQRGKKRKIGGK